MLRRDRRRRALRAALFVAALVGSAALATGCGDPRESSPQRAVTTAAGSFAARTAVASAAATVTRSRPQQPGQPSPAVTQIPPGGASLVLLPPVIEPRVVWDPIPFGPERKAQMVAYAERHYGLHTYRLIHPHVIVIHFTETPDFKSTYNTFAADTPDPELHELPNTCAHFVIDRAGVIHQLVSLGIMCRHTVGLNWTAIGVEHVGYSDQQVLEDPRQMKASLELVRWLRCRFHIRTAYVIGHNESLTSPYHHENVPALRTQTHSDFNHADMQIYRHRLRALGDCQ